MQTKTVGILLNYYCGEKKEKLEENPFQGKAQGLLAKAATLY